MADRCAGRVNESGRVLSRPCMAKAVTGGEFCSAHQPAAVASREARADRKRRRMVRVRERLGRTLQLRDRIADAVLECDPATLPPVVLGLRQALERLGVDS